jgi:AhpD family alkylhydroperoxidase
VFTQHTLESAPAASRPLMISVGKPEVVGKLAESPEMLGSFLHASASFEASTLDPLSREVVVMTIAARNDCRVCIAMHTGRLRQLNAGSDLITALRSGGDITDPKLAAVQTFTLRAFAAAGEVPEEEIKEFLAAGYTTRNALEVVLGIGAYTMSTFANRLVRA